MYLAEDRDETGAPASHFDDSGPAQLWATKDATGTQGAWFVVSEGATPRDRPQWLSHPRRRHRGRHRARSVIPLSRVSFTKNGTAIEITAFGWLDRQLVRLVRSVSIDNSVISFNSDFFSSDHRRVLDADPDVALLGLPVSRVGYTTNLPPELADRFTITVSGDTVTDRATVARVRAGAHGIRSPSENTPAIIGESVADPDRVDRPVARRRAR